MKRSVKQLASDAYQDLRSLPLDCCALILYGFWRLYAKLDNEQSAA